MKFYELFIRPLILLFYGGANLIIIFVYDC